MPFHSNIGAAISNPFMQFLFSLISNRQQGQARDEANERTDRQIEDVSGLFLERGQEGLSLFDASSGSQLQQLQQMLQTIPGQLESSRTDFLSDFDRRGDQLFNNYDAGLQSFLDNLSRRNAGIGEGFSDRYRFAEETLEGFGEQASTDIDRRFEEEAAFLDQHLISRGLSSSTVRATTQLGVTERGSAEQRRLSEALALNQINVLGGMSLEGLLSQERLGSEFSGYQFGGLQTEVQGRAGLNDARAAYDAALRGDVIGTRERLQGNLANFHGTNAINRSQLFMQGSGDFLSFLEGINFIPPPPNQLPFLLGQNAVQPPSAPSTFSTLLPGLVSAGGQLGGAAILGSAFGGAGGAAAGVGAGAAILSDRRLKTDIRKIDESQVLNELRKLPVTLWRYKSGGPEHVGAMADDFKEAFGLGNDTTISVVDAMGVLMASVKALAAEVDVLRSAFKRANPLDGLFVDGVLANKVI